MLKTLALAGSLLVAGLSFASAPATAAPVAPSPALGATTEAPVATVQYYGPRRGYRRGNGYRRGFYGPRRFYGRPYYRNRGYYRPRPFYGRPYYAPRRYYY